MVPSANNQSLLDLSQLPVAKRYFIAFSGGIDSTALLHALVQHPDIDNNHLTAIHINHNIHPDAVKWSEHCQSLCDEYQINFISRSVYPIDHSENACRNERLKVFQDQLSAHDCLLTGHHMNDQVETVLFRMFRGTGINGLTGMSMNAEQQHYQVYRPLLSVSRTAIESYVQEQGLNYVEDPSNQQNHYARNFLRNQVLPLIEQHYPNVIQNILLTRQNLQQTAQLLSQLIGHHNPLNIESIEDPETLASMLYHWLEQFKVVPCNHHALNQFAIDCIHAAHDKLPELSMPDWQLKCWQQRIYLLHHLPSEKPHAVSATITSNKPLLLPDGFGSLNIISEDHLSLAVTIEFQRPQEKIKLSQHKSRQKLKNIFQNNKVPPWERALMPYLYIEGCLMAVGSNLLSQEFLQLLSEHKAEYQWLSPQYLL